MSKEGEQETATPPPASRYASCMQEKEGDKVITLLLQPSTEWKHSVEVLTKSSRELSVSAECESKDSHSAGTSLPKGRRRLALASREALELNSVNALTLFSLKRKASQPSKDKAKVPRTENATSPKPATRSVAVGTYQLKWFVGFGRPKEAERFATKARELFPSINSEKGWNLTIGGNKGPNPNTKRNTEKPARRGAGKGDPKRARGGKKK